MLCTCCLLIKIHCRPWFSTAKARTAVKAAWNQYKFADGAELKNSRIRCQVIDRLGKIVDINIPASLKRADLQESCALGISAII